MNRKEAIEWQEAFRKTYNGMPITVNEATDMAIAALQQTEWIPCSERLPEESGHYIVTVAAREDLILVDTDRMYIDKTWWIDKTYQNSKVIAWMPLPQPYKGEQNE